MEMKNSSVSPVIIVALTTNASATIRNECFEGGINHYISKPFNTRSLAAVIVPSIERIEQMCESLR